jgi:hypothetical protein
MTDLKKGRAFARPLLLPSGGAVKRVDRSVRTVRSSWFFSVRVSPPH